MSCMVDFVVSTCLLPTKKYLIPCKILDAILIIAIWHAYNGMGSGDVGVGSGQVRSG